jgi:hypothetical protein
VLVVDTTARPLPPDWRPGAHPAVIVGVLDTEPASFSELGGYDVVVAAGDPALPTLLERIERHPIACAALAVLLRSIDGLPVEAGLAAESAVYSTLQSGPEFTTWRRRRARRPVPADEEPPVLVERDGARLYVTLNRPRRHNAVSTSLRQHLADAFALALADDTITDVRLLGAGPSFCSGGDLDEFGDFPDPATAHVSRLTASPARHAHHLAARLTAHLHGACMGAGIELPAFADTVIAAEDTVIALPEVELGLIPGAGGTVSVTRRIGRHRTALLALSGMHLDPATAHALGLVDRLE